MNPQQFSNVGGMGRGMPMMQNMGNMNTMGMPQNMAQQKNPQNALAFIYQSLAQSQQNDGPFTGWRGAISIQERAAQIKILFDSLRMLGSTVETRKSLDIAVLFERQQFMKSPTQDAYKQSIHEKLASIRDQRQQNVAGTSNGVPNSAAPGVMNAFPQMPVNQNMNFPQQQGMQPSPMLPQMQQQSMNPNQPSNQQMNPANAANQRINPPPELTKEDNTWINTRAAEMAKSTPRDQMSQIVESMDPRVRHSLTEKKIDPIIYHFRMKATKEFRMQQAQKGGQPQNMMGINMPRMQTPHQTAGMPVNQPNATPFMNNIDQFRGQQEEGMRSQQEGQLVVPASNSAQNQNLNPTPDMMRRQQQVWAQSFRQQNPNASDQEMKQFVMQKYSQFQMQLQRARAHAAQQAGQGQNAMQPQNRLNMLNQPMNQNSPHDSSMQNIPRPQSRPPPNQMMAQGQPPQPQPGFNVQNIQQNMQKLPLQLQGILKQRSLEDWPHIVNEWKQRQARIQQQAFAQQQQMSQAADMQRSASQQAQNMPGNQNLPQMQNPQFPGPSPMQPTLSVGAEQGPQMATMTPAQMQQQGMNANAQQMMRMQQQQQQHHQQQMAQQNAMGQQKPAQEPVSVQMQQVLMRETDGINAPDVFRQRFAHAYAQVNLNVPPLQTWQDYKNFTKAQNQPRVQMQVVMQQQLSFAQRRRQVLANNGMPQMAQMGQPTLQAPNMAQQGSSSGAQPQQQQITVQDIQAARTAHPSWNNLADQQVRDLLATQQSRPPKPQAGNTQVQNQNLAVAHLQNNAKPATQQKPGSQATQPNRPKPQNQSQAVAENKNLKRPNQEDAPEQGNGLSANTIKPNPEQMTKEQFEQMSPADKERFLLQQKQREHARKIANMTREIFAQMKNTPRMTNMDQNSRSKIIAMLTDDNTQKMLSRFDAFLVAFSQSESDQSFLPLLIRHRWHLMQQYTDASWKDRTYQPAENFTLSADNLENILRTVTLKFQQTVKNSTSARTVPQQTTPQAALTTENVEAASQQAAQLQRSKVARSRDGPPPAPTGERPPFQFPSDRGQGAPKYATPGFKPEDLKLPPKKKQRNEKSASPATPVPAQQPRTLLKCPSQGCNAPGFETQAELDHHRSQVHKPEMEPVRDPTGFLHNSLQQGFNLDENLQPKKAAGSAMERTLSQGVKTESKGATLAAMARQSSQQARKDVPFASHKAPLGVPQSKGLQHSTQKCEDEWDNSKFSFEDLVTVFAPIEGGDIIPMATDSQALLDRTYEAYTQTEDYKRVFGDPDSVTPSEESSNKSKSPEQGNERNTSIQAQTQAQGEAQQDPYYVDLRTDGDQLPILEGGLDDLFMGDVLSDDWEKLDTEGSMSPWEKVDEADGGHQQQKAKRDQFGFDSWIPEPGPADGAPFPEEEMLQILEEPTDWDALYASEDPSVYAGGTMAWNAIGKEGEEMRRKLGWPIEGAAGKAKATARK